MSTNTDPQPFNQALVDQISAQMSTASMSSVFPYRPSSALFVSEAQAIQFERDALTGATIGGTVTARSLSRVEPPNRIFQKDTKRAREILDEGGRCVGWLELRAWDETIHGQSCLCLRLVNSLDHGLATENRISGDLLRELVRGSSAFALRRIEEMEEKMVQRLSETMRWPAPFEPSTLVHEAIEPVPSYVPPTSVRQTLTLGQCVDPRQRRVRRQAGNSFDDQVYAKFPKLPESQLADRAHDMVEHLFAENNSLVEAFLCPVNYGLTTKDEEDMEAQADGEPGLKDVHYERPPGARLYVTYRRLLVTALDGVDGDRLFTKPNHAKVESLYDRSAGQWVRRTTPWVEGPGTPTRFHWKPSASVGRQARGTVFVDVDLEMD